MKKGRSQHIYKVKRLVVKVGSSLLTGDKKTGIRTRFLADLAWQIFRLQERGIECLVVTSGAIAAGMAELGLKARPKEIPMLQALAAMGQSNLMHAYEQTFKRRGLMVAQVLLTREDIDSNRRYLNARNTLAQLFHHRVIPVVNENDTVAVEEIKFGDNDNLAAQVAQLIGADLLVLLTDRDGLFSEDPVKNPKAELISEVSELHAGLEKSAAPSWSAVGTGGMVTKLQAARSLMHSGIPMVIANGNKPGVLRGILACEEIGTFFRPFSPRAGKRLPGARGGAGKA